MPCFHSWSMWSRLVRSYSGHKTQFRECLACGKAQFRDLGYCDGVQVEEANDALSEVGAYRVNAPAPAQIPSDLKA